MQSNRQNRVFEAFTLIELMVVIGIIAVLASLLLPVLGKAKNKAMGIACSNKVRQWGIAIRMHVDSNQDKFPFDGTPGQPINKGKNKQAWYNATARYMSDNGLAKAYTITNRLPIPGRSSIFLCPTPTNRLVTVMPTMNKPLFHYGINGRLVTDRGQSTTEDSVLRPVQTVLFTDNTENRIPYVTGRNVLARHDFKAKVAFVDGHVGNVTSNDLRRTARTDASGKAEWATNRVIYWYPNAGMKK